MTYKEIVSKVIEILDAQATLDAIKKFHFGRPLKPEVYPYCFVSFDRSIITFDARNYTHEIYLLIGVFDLNPSEDVAEKNVLDLSDEVRKTLRLEKLGGLVETSEVIGHELFAFAVKQFALSGVISTYRCILIESAT